VFRIIIIFFGLMLSSTVLGKKNTELVLEFSASPTWISGNNNQTINLQPDIVKTYTAGSNNNVFPTLEFFIGGQKHLATHLMSQSFLGQLGLSIVAASNAKLTGNIWEDADPNFNNFNYNYKISHALIAAKGRLIGDFGYFFEPYISGSLGVGFNRAYDFTISPKISEEVPPPLFHSNTTTTFSYTLGIGLQKSISKQLQIGIGYEFADWGKTSLSAATGQTSNKGLTLNHLYAQALKLSLFYV
jgi:opacity protein-like surface antigen